MSESTEVTKRTANGLANVENTDQNLSQAVQVQSIDDVERLGQIMADSGFFEDIKDASQACVKILAGAELGIPPMASMRGVYVFDGNTTLNSSLIGAQIKKSGKYDYEVNGVNSKGAKITFYQHRGDGEWQELGSSVFTFKQAQQANLTWKDNWKNYREDMLFSRAMTRGARRYCPEVFHGPIYTPEEVSAGAADHLTPDVPPRNEATEKEKQETSIAEDEFDAETGEVEVESDGSPDTPDESQESSDELEKPEDFEETLNDYRENIEQAESEEKAEAWLEEAYTKSEGWPDDYRTHFLNTLDVAISQRGETEPAPDDQTGDMFGDE